MGQQGYLRDDSNAIVIPRLERGPLEQLAAANGGQYIDAQLTDADVTALLKRDVIEDNENLKAVEDRKFDAWNETGPWILLLVLPLAAIAFRRGWIDAQELRKLADSLAKSEYGQYLRRLSDGQAD